ncbi:homoserine O-acetyltransferase MetX [Corynebacterium halotolerans]|uniref:Homoserine O-acetyltransferase n=1 Tax=Corynebacterium halotolerans YIM 70093 = DSM 44683 TaxID=1121362 RepID=M1P4Q8_9CORY|nr:homoserine O-acetyltransferase [Corynebacterium halotolerans]AGF71636.1 homoserine O-acetyltransferase [Corynebacterium halotolerans YIM 70093 = DSM 44683]
MANLVPQGELGIQSIGDFRTEAGGTIEDAFIAYQRWGELKVTDDGTSNVLLIEHALTGDSDVAEWWKGLVGPGMALDTDRFCVLCTNVLGGCSGSVGPASRHPDGDHWGSRFPAISIRDQVKAEKTFLDAVGVERVSAVIGGSMGGARTLEWTLMYPGLVDAALVIAVSARASAWQIGIQSSQINMIENDLFWHGGDYHDTGYFPTAGLGSARKLAHLTYRGELEIDERFGSDPQAGEDPFGTFRSPKQRFSVQSYLDHQARKLVERFDAGSYVILTDSLNRHDIGRGRGGLNKALASSTVPTMVVGVDTDILYPYHQQEHLSRNLGNLLAMGKISSPVGHDAFLTEFRQMDNILRRFIMLAGPTLKTPTPEQAGEIEFYI